MTDAPQITPGMQIVEGRLGRPVREYLVDAYETRQLAQVDIAAEIGVDAATVSRWMRRFGIEARVIGHRKHSRTAA